MNMTADLKPAFRPTKVTVDLAALAFNFHLLQKSVALDVFFCPMVKANAYGHGDIQVARKLREEGAAHLGVALIEEALRLRESGDTGSILHFGMFDAIGIKAMIEKNITPVISSLQAFDLLLSAVTAASARSSNFAPVEFHLELNTGMNRLGLDPRDVSEFAKRVSAASAKVRLAAVAMHFSDGDDFGLPGGRSEEQLRRFHHAIDELRAAGLVDFQIHAANSSAVRALGALRKDEESGYHHLGARPGLALYGAEPDGESPKLGLRPVMRFESQIAHVQQIRQGERVSYGGHWTATQDSRIGVIPCGYADGYRRSINSKTSDLRDSKPSVLIRGKRVPVTGTICMDYFMCDLTEVQGAAVEPGETVTLIGHDGEAWISASDVAGWAHTIPYEVFTGISSRVPRVYVDETPLGNVASKL